MGENYLKPKVGAPSLMRKTKNGMFINPPSYAQIGGFTNAGKLNRGGEGLDGVMNLERGGPSSKKGKPI